MKPALKKVAETKIAILRNFNHNQRGKVEKF